MHHESTLPTGMLQNSCGVLMVCLRAVAPCMSSTFWRDTFPGCPQRKRRGVDLRILISWKDKRFMASILELLSYSIAKHISQFLLLRTKDEIVAGKIEHVIFKTIWF